jgi:hypothetical protein
MPGQLLQAVAQEPQQPRRVFVPHEHRDAAQGAASLPPRQLPVDSPDPERVPEVDPDRLPPDGEELFAPDPPNPAGTRPRGEPLGLGHVPLGVAGRLRTASTRVPARRCPSEIFPVTSYQDDDTNRRSPLSGPKDGPTNRSRWKCHAPLCCTPSLQKAANGPYSLCRRLRKAFRCALHSSGSSGHTWG